MDTGLWRHTATHYFGDACVVGHLDHRGFAGGWVAVATAPGRVPHLYPGEMVGRRLLKRAQAPAPAMRITKRTPPSPHAAVEIRLRGTPGLQPANATVPMSNRERIA